MTQRWNGDADTDRRLIEDYLPIQVINTAAIREDKAREGHIKMLHLWRARRPLVAVRGAVYAALIPAEHFVPPNGSASRARSLSRANAAKFIERLCAHPVQPAIIAEAQDHILTAHANHLTVETGRTVTVEDIRAGLAPRPKVLDMFAGGGAIPLEALRLGCEAYALDLNPVAHVIELCTLVYPQKYGEPNPIEKGAANDGSWAGLVAEVQHWGEWVLNSVRTELGDMYPLPRAVSSEHHPASATQDDFWSPGRNKPGATSVPLAYIWTRTVRCKNPSCGALVPLVKQTWLRRKKGRFVALKVLASAGETRARFQRIETPTEEGLGFDPGAGSEGGNATCPFCLTVANNEYVQAEGCGQRVGQQLIAVVAGQPGVRGKRYFAADELTDIVPSVAEIQSRLEGLCRRTGLTLPTEPINPIRPSPNARGLSAVTRHGLAQFVDLFTPRQLLCLLTFANAIRTAAIEMRSKGYSTEGLQAVATSLALALDKMADYSNTVTRWGNDDEGITNAFSRQALPMVWDFAEAFPWSGVTGSFQWALRHIVDVYKQESQWARSEPRAVVVRGSATRLPWTTAEEFDAVITDPPYYDNVPYADISDFFYVWLKRSIGQLYPEHFSSELTPKKTEATALSSRHGGDMTKANAEYETMMLEAFRGACRILKADGRMVVVYAHKTTLGWATLVDALRQAGFTVTESWPLDTESGARLAAHDTASLASSIFLVARKRDGARTGSYEDEVQPDLERIVRERIESLWEMGIAGSDLVIAAVGAGLAAFTRFARVEYANGEEVPATRFLAEVEGVVLETLLEKLFGVSRSGVAAVDGPSRFYVLWRYTYKVAELEAGEAIVFTYGQRVELDGAKGLSHGSRPLVEKRKSKYRLLDFTDRGEDEKLGLPGDDNTPASLIDVLHRILWLLENEPRSVARFLDEARPDRERLRLCAQALAGAGLKGKTNGEAKVLLGTTATEQAALAKLTANWRALIEQRLGEREATGQTRMLFEKGGA